MLCDADSHYVPFEVFKEYSPDYLKRLEIYCPQFDVDSRWKSFYQKIKDDSWPECNKIKDFLLLPHRIKQEIKEEYCMPGEGIFISDNLDFIFYNSPEDVWPRLDTTAMAGKHLLKTDRQVLNLHGLNYSYTNNFHGIEFAKVYNRVMKKLCEDNPRFDTSMLIATNDLVASMDELTSTRAEGFLV
jgi:hypothetical protein